MNSLGIYEKALPVQPSWRATFDLVHQLGFNFYEFSVDESDARLARLTWSKAQREEVRAAAAAAGVRIHTLMLSGHRRFPLGSNDPAVRAKALTMMQQAIDLANDLGIRNIQLAGYDVYYEQKTLASREWYMENMQRCVAMAAAKEVMLAVETMDDPFINTMSKVTALKTQIHSPWLQAYPDLGNLTAWQGTGIGRDLEQNLDHIVSVHLKDTLPVTADSPGKFKNVPFGDGTVDFAGCLAELHRLHYSGAFTIEMWSQTAPDGVAQVQAAKAFFDQLFEQVGIQQEPV